MDCSSVCDIRVYETNLELLEIFKQIFDDDCQDEN